MRTSSLVGIVLGALLMTASPAKAAVISFGSLTPDINGQFALPIGIADAEDVFAFGFNLVFDATVLRFDGVLDSTPADGIGDSPFLARGGSNFSVTCPQDGCPGISVVNTLFGVDAGVSGDGVLTTLLFTAIGFGTAGLQLVPNEFAPATGLLNALLESVLVETAFGTVTVPQPPAPIPEPSTLGLFGIGLFALGRRLRRRKPLAQTE